MEVLEQVLKEKDCQVIQKDLVDIVEAGLLQVMALGHLQVEVEGRQEQQEVKPLREVRQVQEAGAEQVLERVLKEEEEEEVVLLVDQEQAVKVEQVQDNQEVVELQDVKLQRQVRVEQEEVGVNVT